MKVTVLDTYTLRYPDGTVTEHYADPVKGPMSDLVAWSPALGRYVPAELLQSYPFEAEIEDDEDSEDEE